MLIDDVDMIGRPIHVHSNGSRVSSPANKEEAI